MKLNIGPACVALLFGTAQAFPRPELFERAPSCPANQCNAFLNGNLKKAIFLCDSLVSSVSVAVSTSTKFVTKTTGTTYTTTPTTIARGQTTTTATVTESITSTVVIKRQEGSAVAKSFSSSAVATCGGKVSSVAKACSCLSTSTVTTQTIQTPKQGTIVSKVTVASVTKTKYAYSNVVIATVTPTNLIQNGDFEEGSWGRGWDSQDILVVTSPGQGSSTYAGLVNITSTSFDPVLPIYYQNIPVNQGEQYYTSFDLQMLSDQCDLRWWPNGGNEGGFTFGPRGFLSPVGQWTQQKFTFITDGTTEAPLLFVDCPGGFLGPALEIDNIVMLPVSSTIYSSNSPATGTDLVQNGNFGTGALSPFTTSYRAATYSFESPGYNGDSNALVVSLSTDPSQSNFQLFQALPTVKDTVYLVSMAVKVDNAFNANICDFGVALIDPSSNTFASAFDASLNSLPAPGTWGVINGVVAAPMSGVSVQVLMICNNQATNVFHFDDIKVVPIS